MTPIAYVLIDTEYGSCNEVLSCLKKVDGIVEAYKIKKGKGNKKHPHRNCR